MEDMPKLEFDMNETELKNALSFYFFEQKDTTKLLRFIDQINMHLGKTDKALIVLGAVAAYAVSARNNEIFNTAIDRLYHFYLSINNYDKGAINKKLNILLALYAIGASIDITERWELISPFVNKQSNAEGSASVYASWIRECEVDSFNAGMLSSSNKKEGLIAQALTDINEHPILSPDVKLNIVDKSESDNEFSESDNILLDALCAFDFLYCICVFVAGEGEFSAYPAFVEFPPKRIKKIDRIMFGVDEKIRRTLLPDYTDEQIASGLIEFRDVLRNEAMNSSSYYWSMSCVPNLEAFIAKYATE